jgi:hypothetical protein
MMAQFEAFRGGQLPVLWPFCLPTVAPPTPVELTALVSAAVSGELSSDPPRSAKNPGDSFIDFGCFEFAS